MLLLNCFVLAALWAILWANPSSFTLLPLSDDQHARLHSIALWALALALAHQLNAVFSRWAERNWMLAHDMTAWTWERELAVVTGGSNGIGAAVVQELVSHGITVAVLDLQPLGAELQNVNGDKVRFYECDITSREAVHRAGEAVRSDHGHPSILINNAGIGNTHTVMESTPTSLTTIFNVNLISHWYTVQEFMPDMIRLQKGHIMSVASTAAFVGLAGMTDYCCTKAGLAAFHEGLTQELKHRFNAPMIKTSIVYPGWAKTRLTVTLEKEIKASGASMMEPKQVAEAMVARILTGKSGQMIVGPSAAGYVRALPTWLQELVRDRMAHIVTGQKTTAVA